MTRGASGEMETNAGTARDARFFLCFGMPKCGTTMLQRILDLHPEISCPSEQQLENLGRDLEGVLGEYGRLLRRIDARTGGQGAPAVTNDIVLSVFRETVLTLSRAWAGDRPVHGLNENAVLGEYVRYRRLFPNARMIMIARNAVDHGVSLWLHNRRLIAAEPQNAAEHRKRLSGFEDDPVSFVGHRLDGYAEEMNGFLDQADGDAGLLVLRFEDLVERPARWIRQLFRFLDVTADAATVARIVEQSGKSRMRARAAVPGFFTEETAKQGLIPEAERRRLLAQAGDVHRRLGYDVERLSRWTVRSGPVSVGGE